jgi:hypothetical protein
VGVAAVVLPAVVWIVVLWLKVTEVPVVNERRYSATEAEIRRAFGSPAEEFNDGVESQLLYRFTTNSVRFVFESARIGDGHLTNVEILPLGGRNSHCRVRAGEGTTNCIRFCGKATVVPKRYLRGRWRTDQALTNSDVDSLLAMVTTEQSFLGEWCQIEPNPDHGSIFITFEVDGRLRYTIETATIQHILLTWHIDGDVLVTDQPSAPREERTHFRFQARSQLVLERHGEGYTYERLHLS